MTDREREARDVLGEALERLRVDQYGNLWLIIERPAGEWAFGYAEDDFPACRQVFGDEIVTDYAHATAVRKLRRLSRWPILAKRANRIWALCPPRSVCVREIRFVEPASTP